MGVSQVRIKWNTGNTFVQRVRYGAVALVMVLPGISPAVFSGPDVLLQTQTTWEGGDIVYPNGDAEVTSVILRIEEGQEPPFHCHPVPTMGYVLSGEAQVETAAGESVILKEGDAVVEVLRTVHRGKALRGPVEILVFYAGAAGTPNTVLPDDALASVHCDL